MKARWVSPYWTRYSCGLCGFTHLNTTSLKPCSEQTAFTMSGTDLFCQMQKSLVNDRNQYQGRISASYTVSPSAWSSCTKRLTRPLMTRSLPSACVNFTVAGVRMSFAALMPGSFARRPSVYLKPPAIDSLPSKLSRSKASGPSAVSTLIDRPFCAYVRLDVASSSVGIVQPCRISQVTPEVTAVHAKDACSQTPK